MKQQSSSIYKGNPPKGSHVLLRSSSTTNPLTIYDRIVVYGSSIFFVGGIFWVPALYIWAWRRYQRIPKTKDQNKRRALYGALLIAITALYFKGPHRSKSFGENYIHVHKWSLWKSWFKFFSLEVIADNIEAVKQLQQNNNNNKNKNNKKPIIIAISPHGIFPFGLAFAALSDAAKSVFGNFRAVVAPATQMLPWIRDVLKWVNVVDASREEVNRALSEGSTIGLAPGGIAEMFEGYPKPLSHPSEETTIIRRGIFKMAIEHQIPIIPCYCFGSTKLLKRLQLPSWIEKLSLLLRTSLVVFFGQWGLPIPFRQKLLYVIGTPIHPPPTTTIGGFGGDMNNNSNNNNQNQQRQQQQMIDDMLNKYCTEMVRIFDRHKESYGWSHKTLTTIRR